MYFHEVPHRLRLAGQWQWGLQHFRMIDTFSFTGCITFRNIRGLCMAGRVGECVGCHWEWHAVGTQLEFLGHATKLILLV